MADAEGFYVKNNAGYYVKAKYLSYNGQFISDVNSTKASSETIFSDKMGSISSNQNVNGYVIVPYYCNIQDAIDFAESIKREAQQYENEIRGTGSYIPSLLAAMTKGNPGLILAERDEESVATVAMVPGDHFSSVRTATVQLLHVAPKARGGPAAATLLRAIRRWAATNGAHDLHVNVTTGIGAARTDRFLRKMGFQQTGGNYVLSEFL